mgnify:CR=1 FL=1
MAEVAVVVYFAVLIPCSPPAFFLVVGIFAFVQFLSALVPCGPCAFAFAGAVVACTPAFAGLVIVCP